MTDQTKFGRNGLKGPDGLRNEIKPEFMLDAQYAGRLTLLLQQMTGEEHLDVDELRKTENIP